MKRVGLMLSLSLVLAGAWTAPIEAGAAAPATVTAATPEIPAHRVNEHPNALLSALKQNDFPAFLQTMQRYRTMQNNTDTDITTLAKKWDDEAQRVRATRAERAAERAENGDAAAEAVNDDPVELAWQKLQSDAGVDLLVAELQPELAEAASKRMMEFNMGLGVVLASIASDKEFNAEQVQQLTQLMYAVQNWSGRVDFSDPERLRRALQALSRLVRQTGLEHFEEVQTLSFEEAVVHGDTLMKVAKQALAAYDIDADEILNSVRLSEVDAVGDQATLRAEARVFGVYLAHDFKQRYFEGGWMDADAVQTIRDWRANEGRELEEAAERAAQDQKAQPAVISAPAPVEAE
jgi:hypothetical protein